MITKCGVRSHERCMRLQPGFKLDSDSVLPRITFNFSPKEWFDTSYTSYTAPARSLWTFRTLLATLVGGWGLCQTSFSDIDTSWPTYYEHC